jgi:hypothetical protein
LRLRPAGLAIKADHLPDAMPRATSRAWAELAMGIRAVGNFYTSLWRPSSGGSKRLNQLAFVCWHVVCSAVRAQFVCQM